MGQNWSLKEIYQSFQCDEIKDDMQRVDGLICDFKKIVDEAIENHDDETKKIEKYIGTYQEVLSLLYKINSFAHLTISVDSKHKEARKYSDMINVKFSGLTECITKMSKWISQVKNIDVIIAESNYLSEYEFFLNEIIEESKYMLSEKEESIVAKMRNTGSKAWGSYKNLLISTHKVDMEFDGEQKEIPLTMVLNMAYDSDKEIRKKAYEAEIESYKKIEDGLASALNAIKGEVITVCEMKGYKNPLDMTLESSRMDEKMLDSMLDAIRESLPSFRKYLRRKAEILGYENGLPFYEMYAPVIQKDMEFDFEAGKKFVEENFRNFSDSLGDFAKKAFDNNWIDVMPKEGKVGGAFCSRVSSIKESRILLNYGNSFSDVVTMAHELGHGFHGKCLNNEELLNTDYPMTLAETASNFCEIIVKKGAIKTSTEEEAFAILESEISDCAQVIVDIYSRFLFESELFKRREESSLSVDEIKEIMIEAQREAYGDGLDQNLLHPYMWTWKPHYYYATANFYNFPYAFGNLFAKGLYAEYLIRGESFCNEYENLLAVTGKMKVEDVTKIMNIDVHDINFWRKSLKLIEDDIEKFIKLSYEVI